MVYGNFLHRQVVGVGQGDSSGGQRPGRTEVRWLPGQETSFPPPCSDLRSCGSKCTLLKKVQCLRHCWDFSGPGALPSPSNAPDDDLWAVWDFRSHLCSLILSRSTLGGKRKSQERVAGRCPASSEVHYCIARGKMRADDLNHTLIHNYKVPVQVVTVQDLLNWHNYPCSAVCACVVVSV